MAIFNVRCPLNGGTLDTYYRDAEYPYDLNGSLDFVRPATGFSTWPFPLTVPSVQGLVPLTNVLQFFGMMKGHTPTGPELNMLSNPVAQQMAFPDIRGGMVKVSG